MKQVLTFPKLKIIFFLPQKVKKNRNNRFQGRTQIKLHLDKTMTMSLDWLNLTDLNVLFFMNCLR